jgi:hypothetical protein
MVVSHAVASRRSLKLAPTYGSCALLNGCLKERRVVQSPFCWSCGTALILYTHQEGRKRADAGLSMVRLGKNGARA